MKVRLSGIQYLVPIVLLSVACGHLKADNESKPEFPTATPAEVNVAKLVAQRAALSDLTGEDPYVLRETGWSGHIAPGDAKLIQVQLFLRNSYKFWFAVPGRESDLNLNIYNGEGILLDNEMVR